MVRVRGARTHNLRGLDVDLPRNRLVVVTGVSGSGKSSLAFDTLHAEGRRRYLETLSPNVRARLDQWPRPDVDQLTGLPPTLAIGQSTGAPRPRSLLATVTELHDFLRLWYARAGVLHCPTCQLPVARQSPAEIVARVMSLEAGRKVMLLAPLVRQRKGTHADVFEKIARLGLIRARVDGELIDVAQSPALAKTKPHSIEAVIDRVVVKEGLETRLRESVELAIRIADGNCLVAHQTDDGWAERLYSTKLACLDCGTSFPPVEPRTFSFHSPYGACSECDGMGTVGEAEIGTDAVPCPACHGSRLGSTGRHVRWRERSLPDLLSLTVSAARTWFDAIDLSDPNQPSATDLAGPVLQEVSRRLFPEIVRRLRFMDEVGLGYLQLDRSAGTLSGGELQRARLAQALGGGPAGACYVLDEPTCGLHPRDTRRLLDTLFALRDRGNSLIIVEHDLDVVRAADHVVDLGPGAGREGGLLIGQGTPAQLMQQPASLTGQALSDETTVCVGEIRGIGFQPVIAPPESQETRQAGSLSYRNDSALRLTGASLRNLGNVSVDIPLGQLVCVTGVSGSGKSTLVMGSLVPLVRRALDDRDRAARDAAFAARPARGKKSVRPASEPSPLPAALGRLETGMLPGRLVVVDQLALATSGRGNPATAAGLWDDIRRFFARTKEARLRGFTARRFSWNAPGGRCETCRGHGQRPLRMGFLPDVWVDCPDCRGQRFNAATLQPRFRGKTIADILDLRIDEAAAFFENFALLRDKLKVLADIGLGYLTLGQPATSLSGGEAQRLKLGRELLAPPEGSPSALFVLDEPTRGLHVADVERLLEVLRRLIARGHSVLVIEHHPRLIVGSDYVIDLGPEGGAEGGRIVACGSPDVIAASTASLTGAALRGEYTIRGRTMVPVCGSLPHAGPPME
jgi:excinuclease ABC subunit A